MRTKVVSEDSIKYRWTELINSMNTFVENFVSKVMKTDYFSSSDPNAIDFSPQSVANAIIYRRFVGQGEFALSDGQSAKIIGANGSQITILVGDKIDEIYLSRGNHFDCRFTCSEPALKVLLALVGVSDEIVSKAESYIITERQSTTDNSE